MTVSPELAPARPRAQRTIEKVIYDVAKERCVDGASILNAHEVRGGIVRAEFALWVWTAGNQPPDDVEQPVPPPTPPPNDNPGLDL